MCHFVFQLILGPLNGQNIRDAEDYHLHYQVITLSGSNLCVKLMWMAIAFTWHVLNLCKWSDLQRTVKHCGDLIWRHEWQLWKNWLDTERNGKGGTSTCVHESSLSTPTPPAKLSVFVLQVGDLLSYIFSAGKTHCSIKLNSDTDLTSKLLWVASWVNSASAVQ